MHVAITGASSGIGEALAREFGRTGAKLTLVARRRELLDKLAADVGTDGCHCVTQDLSDAARAAGWIAAAEAVHGPVDVMINNAGMENTGPTPAPDVDVAERLLLLNLHAPLRITRALLPAMCARRSGTIVNVASTSALVSPPGQAWYGASKAGLAMFSETLRGELRGTGVNVVTVYPGPVKTAMSDSAYAAFGGRKGLAGMLPEGRTDVLARRIRAAVERRSARLVYPRMYVLNRWFPTIIRALVARAVTF